MALGLQVIIASTQTITVPSLQYFFYCSGIGWWAIMAVIGIYSTLAALIYAADKSGRG